MGILPTPLPCPMRPCIGSSALHAASLRLPSLRLLHRHEASSCTGATHNDTEVADIGYRDLSVWENFSHTEQARRHT